MTRPMITIGMPIYNAGELLYDAVDSILKQSYLEWELLIVDDGSTDDAINKVRDTGLLNDSRIKIYADNQNKGLAARLNECISLANSKYFARMDQDDIAMPDRLAKQLAHLEKFPEIDLLACRVHTINTKGEITGDLPYALTHNELCAKPWKGIYMPHPTWMGKTIWFKKFLYAQPAPYLCEDQELLLRTHTESRFACLDEVLLHYRERDRINPRKLLMTYWSVFRMQCRYFATRNKTHVIMATSVLVGHIFKTLLISIKQAIL